MKPPPRVGDAVPKEGESIANRLTHVIGVPRSTSSRQLNRYL